VAEVARLVTYCWSAGFVSANSPVVRGTICNVPPPSTIFPPIAVDTTDLSLLRVAVTVRFTCVKAIAASVAVTANAAEVPNEDDGGEEMVMFDEDVTVKSTMSPDAAFGSVAVIFTTPEQSRQSARLAVSELTAKGGSVTISESCTACARFPGEAFIVMVKVPAARAVNVTGTGLLVPTMNENVEGDVVMPDGACTAACTVPLKPFEPATVTFTGALAVPVVAEMEAGETNTLKSGLGGAVTLSVAGAVWTSAPLVPLKAIAALPAAADAEAEKVTCWLAPGLTEKGEAGEEETFCGSPWIETLTEPVKPFWPVTETVTGVLVAPRWMDAELGVAEMLKSG
jgi:hypothetical protein